MEGRVPKFKKVGHVTLATPTFIVCCEVLAMADLTKEKRSV